MTQEEKAKAYDEAIEKLKEITTNKVGISLESLTKVSISPDTITDMDKNELFEVLFEVLSGNYGSVFTEICMWQCINALGIKPYKDGNQWCFLYGNNIQEGVCGFGNTIYEAAKEFYNNIENEEN